MYRDASLQRLYVRLHTLKRKEQTTNHLLSRIELHCRIENLKNLIALTTKERVGGRC